MLPTNSPTPPLPLSTASDAVLKKIKGVCFDIDDTFSTHGQITSEAYQALWELKKAGFFLIPVTGRPAGWCDLIARFWPVHAVVGENGAFTFFMENGVRRRIDTLSSADSKSAQSRLSQLRTDIEKQFHGCSFASDQSYREYDLAIDFCEDVPAWEESEVERLVKFCESKGAIAKISSIHVNTWFGRYTKFEGITHFLKQRTELPKISEWIYAGDSPNDEPLFQAFPLSVGVANVKKFLPKMKSPPTYITLAEGGGGFAELAQRLISAR